MKTIFLGKLANIKTGKIDVNVGSEDGAYPFFTCATAPYKINQYAFDDEAVLIAGNGDLNVKYYKGKFNAYQRTYVIQNNDKEVLSMKYLYYFMETYMGRLRRDAIGGIIRYIKLGHLTEAAIPLPPLDDQKRIAYLLGKVEGLITRRKHHLQQLDDLLKSVFLEMFGDPVRNEKGWEDYLFSNLFSSSPRIGTTKPVSPDGTTLVVRVGELGEFQVNFKKCKKVTLEKDTLDKCRVEGGDILLARAIASQSHLGKASLITNLEQDTAFDSHVMRIRFKEKLVNPVFAYHWLKSDGGRNRFLNAGGQTSVQFNINSKQISSIKIPLPPIDLQNQFAAIGEKVESLKSRYQHSLTDLENLYGALSQKAFKGQLDLSRVVLPVASTRDVFNRETHEQRERKSEVAV